MSSHFAAKAAEQDRIATAARRAAARGEEESEVFMRKSAKRGREEAQPKETTRNYLLAQHLSSANLRSLRGWRRARRGGCRRRSGARGGGEVLLALAGLCAQFLAVFWATPETDLQMATTKYKSEFIADCGISMDDEGKGRLIAEIIEELRET